MGYEVEIKFHASDPAGLEAKLHALGATRHPALEQADVYLAHPSRDFAKTNEAFRVRFDGESNRITYKGPKHDGPTKTREEIEIAFMEGAGSREEMVRLFERLGFRQVATIRKIRRPFSLKRGGLAIEVTIDRAEGLGTFAEVEALAARTDDLVAAQAAVLELAKELGLSDVEPRSYLRMHLELAANRSGQI